ncbi:hypothetical protein P1X15_19615 [Runella sp. MFBS21]|uniref:hypothetical protein n=1 Tax=Runella sp. MFBS21 TaxID=3034018 RepID=UPI0023F871D3|nr:hypothetical protein [Runella sp. MFBS21]MDF7819839.1 hypothetical protein [Runella sp. MFBS21]
MKFYSFPIKTISTIIISIFLFNCTSFKYTNGTYDKSTSKNIGVLKPISIIGIVGEKNKMNYDSILSIQITSQLLNNTIEVAGTNKTPVPIEADNDTEEIIYKEVFALGQKLNSAKSKKKKQIVVDNYEMSEAIYQLMNEKQLDQLIISYHKGFSRTKSNYRNQNWKGLGVGLLTLGAYIPTPIKANSLIYTWVFDKNKKSIVFSNMSIKEIEPTDTNEFIKQICELYLGFYTEKTPEGLCFHR